MVVRVLVVDDSQLSRRILKSLLPPELNAEFTEAGNGKLAMAACRAGPFDLMFLDLTMPEMDGYEVLEALRHENISLPVIVVSADIQPTAVDRVYALGAAAFVAKPISAKGLREALIKVGMV